MQVSKRRLSRSAIRRSLALPKKHNEEISSLTQLIEASGDLETRISDWIENLVPATEQLKEYLQTGMRLYSVFSKYATEKKEQEDFREKFKLFARRTDREQQPG